MHIPHGMPTRSHSTNDSPAKCATTSCSRRSIWARSNHRPPTTTPAILRVLAIRSSGLASRSPRSALFPAVNVPLSGWRMKICWLRVAVSRAWYRVNPATTIKTSADQQNGIHGIHGLHGEQKPCGRHRVGARLADENVRPTQSCSLFVLERLFRVVNVIRLDDQNDRNVLTVGPGLSDVLS